VIALVATSVATLAAAGLAVFPLLEHRLVADRLADLRGLARTARPALLAIPARDLRPGSPSLLRLEDHLERRTGGRIAIYEENTALTEATATRIPLALRDLERDRRLALRHRDGVASGRLGELVYGVTVVRSGRERLTLVIAKRLEDTRAAAGVMRAALPLAAVAGLVVALGLALLLSRSLLGRLERLRDDARALGEEGLAHPVSVSGGDEVAEVAHALEGMRAALVEEEASRQAFVATASHELRTPLASLQATLELLREDVLAGHGDAASTAARADTALRQTHRLVGLATDLLDLSRVDGGVPLRLEPVELGELAGTIAPEFAGRLEARGRRLTVEGGPVLAVADPAAVARIVRVLLDNSSNYGDGPTVVRVAGSDGTAWLSVTDEGPGLADDEHDRVFVRFARGRAAYESPGAGLGLAIARGLARALGGDLEASAIVPGARFTLTLPAWDGEPVGDHEHPTRA
jgi:signal transduction histidine kinase